MTEANSIEIRYWNQAVLSMATSEQVDRGQRKLVLSSLRSRLFYH